MKKIPKGAIHIPKTEPAPLIEHHVTSTQKTTLTSKLGLHDENLIPGSVAPREFLAALEDAYAPFPYSAIYLWNENHRDGYEFPINEITAVEELLSGHRGYVVSGYNISGQSVTDHRWARLKISRFMDDSPRRSGDLRKKGVVIETETSYDKQKSDGNTDIAKDLLDTVVGLYLKKSK
ncbi:TPA: hypothetical protein HA251_02275 [Candidatus Woesearchaeota archaeon]|nr:hypothetical protein [Candidatus Woesearchaeota archaeon]